MSFSTRSCADTVALSVAIVSSTNARRTSSSFSRSSSEADTMLARQPLDEMTAVARAGQAFGLARREREIGRGHLLHERLERRLRLPAELLFRERRIAEQRIDLGRPVILRMD